MKLSSDGECVWLRRDIYCITVLFDAANIHGSMSRKWFNLNPKPKKKELRMLFHQSCQLIGCPQIKSCAVALGTRVVC